MSGDLKKLFTSQFISLGTSVQFYEFFSVIVLDCNMAFNSTLSYSCSNNTLEVRWPTDIVFAEHVKDIPTKVKDMLSSSLKNFGRKKAEILIFSRYPQ